MENKEINPVQILTVKNKVQLFKREESANSIELIQLEEVGFEIVAQKDLYEVKDKVVYIQPDYCLSDISLFESYLRPEKGSCKLGSNNRIRAIKFNLHKGDGLPVYSQGILLPIGEVWTYLEINNPDFDPLYQNLDKPLGIIKWEEPEEKSRGGLNVRGSKPFPEGLYKTDETNINNLWGHINFPIELIATEKIDGSSITIGVKDGEGFICSRNLRKPIIIKKIIGRKKKSFLQKLIFWKKNWDLNIYEEVLNIEDDFVKYGLPYLEILKETTDNVCFRGELSGGSMKGSGNKNNPASKQSVNIQFFGMDIYENHIWKKASGPNFIETVYDINLYVSNSKNLFKTVKIVEHKVFNSKEEVEECANNYFKTNMIEGLVFRNIESTFSAKFMNLSYDAKK